MCSSCIRHGPRVLSKAGWRLPATTAPGVPFGLKKGAHMPRPLSHADISARFLESGSLNFDAVGDFMAKIGPELVTRDDGLHGVISGRFSTLACFLRADDLQHVFGGLRGGAGLAEAVDLQKG